MGFHQELECRSHVGEEVSGRLLLAADTGKQQLILFHILDQTVQSQVG